MDILDFTIEELRKLKLLANAPTNLAAIESQFHIKFPPDVHAVAAEFGAGRINDYQQFDTPRVIEETERLRALGRSTTKIVIGNLEGYLVAYEFGLPQPLIQAVDTDELAAFTYTGLILEQIERIRYQEVHEALARKYPDLTAKAAQQWRHRWSREELETIDAELERGKQIPDGLPSDDEDDRARSPLRDLRGIVRQVKGPWERGERRMNVVRHERTDFSFCQWDFDLVDARDCVFRAASFGARESRFERCDFTMIDCSSRSPFLQDQLGSEFMDCDFTGAVLAECALNGTFTRCNFTAANLWWARPQDATFTDCTFAYTRFGGDARHWDDHRTGW